MTLRSREENKGRSAYKANDLYFGYCVMNYNLLNLWVSDLFLKHESNSPFSSIIQGGVAGGGGCKTVTQRDATQYAQIL